MPIIHSCDSSAPVKAIVGEVLGGVAGGGVAGGVVAGGVVAGGVVAGVVAGVTGGAVMSSSAGSEAHGVGDVQPGPLQVAVLATTSVGSPEFAVAENVRVYVAPGVAPAGIVQVMAPPLPTLTVHVVVPPEQAGEPLTSVVPGGAASNTWMGAVVVTVPVFFTVMV